MPSKIRHRNLPHLMLRSREALMDHFRPLLNEQGVTEQQWRVMRALLEGGPLEPRQLCEICLISSPSIAGVLARMEEAGLVERERMDHDLRRVNVTLSNRGRQLARGMASRVDDRYEALERLVGVKQLTQVYDVLDMLLRMLEAAEAGNSDNGPATANSRGANSPRR